MRDVLLRVGLIAPDTAFNRRADEYAKTTYGQNKSRAYQRRKAAKGKL